MKKIVFDEESRKKNKKIKKENVTFLCMYMMLDAFRIKYDTVEFISILAKY